MTPVSKILMVEGVTEKRLIPELMEHNGVVWETSRNHYAVKIEDYGGFEKMMDPKELATVLKTSGLVSVGIVFDADDLHEGFSNRWATVANAMRRIGLDIPEQIPPEGLIADFENGIKVGAWMMPDNRNRGMLETFLMQLIPVKEGAEALYNHSVTSTDEASKLGAPFKSAHRDKALIHTWLAWQDVPGAQLHHAVKTKILDPTNPAASLFVNWFKALFSV